MIQPSELRLGNWVLWCDRVPVKYSGTALYGSGQFGMAGKILMPQVEYGGHQYYQVAWKTLYPIPLTPEVLERCGFEKMNDHPYWHIGAQDYYFWNNNGFVLAEKNSGFYKFFPVEDDFYSLVMGDKIEYLHHLQNLIHALTGNELEYKP